MRFSPHFQLFYFNDRLEFCEFFEWKIKRINNADFFSQLPLVIFTKGANISGGHCNSFLFQLYSFDLFIFANASAISLSTAFPQQISRVLTLSSPSINIACLLLMATIVELGLIGPIHFVFLSLPSQDYLKTQYIFLHTHAKKTTSKFSTVCLAFCTFKHPKRYFCANFFMNKAYHMTTLCVFSQLLEK